MAQGGNRNQKQAAKAAKRKAAVAVKIRSERLATSLSGQIAAAAAAPVHRCLRTADITAIGLGHVILVRQFSLGTFACAFFLVDLLCLGAKDAFYREMAPSEFDDYLEKLGDESQVLVDIAPAAARSMITGAVAFAAASGFEPAKDFRTVFKMFGDIVADASIEPFTFGKDGKAVFIPGPNDSMTRMREVERVLEHHRGPDGWDVEFGPEADETMRRLSEMLEAASSADDGPFHDERGGPIIEHEGSTEAEPGAAVEPT